MRDGAPDIDPLEPADPDRVGPYLLLGRLGAGGMGVVYVARREHDPQSPRVAIKLLRGELARDADFRERFRREVSAAMRVESRHTARVLAADIDAPQPWLATELVPGSCS